MPPCRHGPKPQEDGKYHLSLFSNLLFCWNYCGFQQNFCFCQQVQILTGPINSEAKYMCHIMIFCQIEKRSLIFNREIAWQRIITDNSPYNFDKTILSIRHRSTPRQLTIFQNHRSRFRAIILRAIIYMHTLRWLIFISNTSESPTAHMFRIPEYPLYAYMHAHLHTDCKHEPSCHMLPDSPEAL